MHKVFIAAPFLALSALPVQAFDQLTTEALSLCHNYLWEVPEYEALPNAAISVFPGILEDTVTIVFWNVYWDDPSVRAAGNCTIIEGSLEGFEDYTANE